MQWFRHYTGMARDEKLVAVSVRSGQPVERVIWVWTAILESASEIGDGGRYELDAAEAAYFLRTNESDIHAILDALADAERLADGIVVKWGDRQFHSDKSAARQAAYRERKRKKRGDSDGVQNEGDVTPSSPQRHVTPQDTDTDTERIEPKGSLSVQGTDAPKPKRISYPQDFEDFWKSYPTDPLMSKKEAAAKWTRLSAEDRQLASKAVPAFAAHCAKNPDYRPLHACRFLSQRRFEGFAETTAGTQNVVDFSKLTEKYGWKPGKPASSSGPQ